MRSRRSERFRYKKDFQILRAYLYLQAHSPMPLTCHNPHQDPCLGVHPDPTVAWDPTVALRQDLTGVQMVSEVTHGVTVGIMEVQAHGVHSEAAHGVAEEAHGLHIVGVNVGASDPHGGEKL